MAPRQGVVIVTNPQSGWIDHLTFAGEFLPAMREDLQRAGIATEFGGKHAHGLTHMALAAFADGSYLEVVSPVAPGGRVPLWQDYELPPSGGTAWTAASGDIDREFSEARARGVPAQGPLVISRAKPNGEVGSWKLGYFGSAQPGGVLPFVIQDTSPRSVRVPPDGSAAGLLSGWQAMVLAVHDMRASAADLVRLYGWPVPEVIGDMLHFRGTPVYLASPAAHLAMFGESPCMGILGLTGDTASASRFATTHTGQVADKTVRWLDLPWQALRIGLDIAD